MGRSGASALTLSYSTDATAARALDSAAARVAFWALTWARISIWSSWARVWPVWTWSLMSVLRSVTMPEALDLTSTLVMGWTLPVATTERAMSPRSALPSWEGSSLVPLPRAATVQPRATMTTRAMRPVQIQILRLLLRFVATMELPRVLVEGRYGLGLYYAAEG